MADRGPHRHESAPARGADADAGYLNDAAAIYRRSFEIIAAETDLSRFPGAMKAVALRVIHACGDPSIAPDLIFSEGAAEIGCAALAGRAAILVDAAMVAHGIVPVHLPQNNRVVCTLHDERTAPRAKRLGTTRSAAAVDLWDEWLAGAVIAIGNAPTALFRLIEKVKAGGAKPALVLGFAVGFVGAAEAKAALIRSGLPHITLIGRRGGSAMAAAAVNALGRAAQGLAP